MKGRTIKVDYMARVEGEGAFAVRIAKGKVVDSKLKIFEPPRFFEAFLRGRMYTEAPDITARICGICPVAYQMSSVQAMEAALGVQVDPMVRALRRLLYCGEWIESHALHIYMLHAPDFLGYDDAIRMAKDHPEAVNRALQLKKVGNDVMILVGGREIHPINVKVGGFYKMPSRPELLGLVDRLKWARDASLETIRFTASLPLPDFEREYEFVALRHPEEYPILDGRVVSGGGIDIPVSEYERHFVEEHVGHSNALHSIVRARGEYLVGPLARYNLNFDRLPPAIQAEARSAGLGTACRNPFRGIVVRAVETLYACEEALRLIDLYESPKAAPPAIVPKASVGHGISEAPRGILYHRYRLDGGGHILDAKIVPPTSQNLRTIESDLREFVERDATLPDERLRGGCETIIRNYDPCISCATHFLKLDIRRE
jgi:coenzyme F420-reducing hydrogenase alpha subunit